MKKLTPFFKNLFNFSAFKNSKFNRIRNKLMTAFVVIIIPVIILGAVSYSISARAIEGKVTQSSTETIQQTGNYLNLLFSNLEDLTFQIFNNEDIQDFLNSSDDNISKTKSIAVAYLNSISHNNKFISGISLIGYGTRSYSSGEYSLLNFELSSMKDDELYKKVEMDRTVRWMGYHQILDQRSPVKGYRYAVSVVRSISDMRSGDLNGILVIDLKTQNIMDILKQLDFGEDSEIHLISPDGRDISPSLIDENSPEAVQSAQTIRDLYIKIGNSDTELGTQNTTYNNKPYLAVYSKIGKTGYTLLSLISKASLLADAGKIRLITIILVFITGLFAVAIGYYMSRGMGRTIKQIINAADLAASGDMTVAPVTKRKDEFGKLTESINIMISNTRELIEHVFITSEKVGNSSLNVSETSQSVATVSSEIANAIQTVSEGAMEQASDVEQSVQMINQLSDMIHAVSENIRKIEKLSDETMNYTAEGGCSVKNLELKSKATTENVHLIFSDIGALNNNTKSIKKIVKVIQEIADQVGLLALNAAIEAARAGDAGRGFSVVASEVRNLAEQSTAAAQDISSIIESTLIQTEKTVSRTTEVEETLNSQNEAVTSALAIFNKISSATESLSERLEAIASGVKDMELYKGQIIQCIENISVVSEEAASSSEEVTASSEEQTSSIEELAANAVELGNAAQSLSGAIKKFKIK